MKHVDLFNEFLRDTVNLNQSRIDSLEESIDAIKTAIEDSAWKPKIREWVAQGSWAHKTIIKPVDQGEFDADLLVFVDPVQGWSATDYIEHLYLVFRANGTYKSKVKRWSHCVTVSYANDKRIDVAPCVVNRGGFIREEVCNRQTGEFEQTAPRSYTNWLIDRNGYSGSNSFRKVTRIIKFLRDIKGRFTCSSVLLTTILGYRISSSDKNSNGFADTPTALKTIFGRMDDWLQLNEYKPSVANPFLASEDFAAVWTDDQYSNFREKIHKYREWVDDAYDERDRSESIAKWRRLFGEEFASGVVLEEGSSVSKVAVAALKASVSEAALFAGDLVAAVKRFGARALPTGFDKRPWMESPTWGRAVNQLPVAVRATIHRQKNDGQSGHAVGSLDPLAAGNWLNFRAFTSTGIPFDADTYRVEWRVTNTDEAAARENQLRGHFEKPEKDNSRWESLKYRGVHIVEAFVIRKRGEVLVGHSPPFRVMIE